jgi:hypothetical protein
MSFLRVRGVTPLAGRAVRLELTDGTTREVDLTRYLYGPIFAPVRDDDTVFRAVFVENGTVAWPNGADIDPDVLLDPSLTPVWAEENAEGAALWNS